MKYRNFGKLDYKPSALGFGSMRLPTLDGNPMSDNIDEEKAINMIRYGIDNGINYVDTAYFYHKGKSEVVVGKSLKDGYREKVKLATKSPIILIKEEGDFDRILAEQMERLDVDCIDMYLMHALNAYTWENVVKKFNIMEKAEKAKSEGKIKHIGFSFHDKYEAFETIIDGYDKWEFCQIQLNYFDTDFQAGLKGLKYAASKGLAVVVMEPLRGGQLSQISGEVFEPLNKLEPKKTATQWALDWVWNLPETSLLISGMSTMEQVEQNISYAGDAQVDKLSSEELKAFSQVDEKIKAKTPIPCTSCEYCMPCPHGVSIPRNFRAYNESFMFENSDLKRSFQIIKIFGGKTAEECIGCKICEAKCPQQINISKEMITLREHI